MDKKFLAVIAKVVLVEALITYIDNFFIQGILDWHLLASVFIGITVAVAYKLDIPALFEMNSAIPYLGNIISGILISRGSNYITTLLEKLVMVTAG